MKALQTMRYITSMPLIYNEVFYSLYDRLKELKENGKEIYFSCDEGVSRGKERLQEFNALAPGAGYGDIFTDVIGYDGGRDQSAKAIMNYASENKIDVNEFIQVTNSDTEHSALLKENIKSVNIWFFTRDQLLCDWDQILPG
jgi:hypothetical protein